MTWRTAKELAGLPGMPSSERRTRDRLTTLGIPSRPREGRFGGGGLEYDCAALPAYTRKALLLDSISTAGAVITADGEFQAPANAPAVTAIDTVPSAQARRAPSQRDKAVADARLILITTVKDLSGTDGITRACKILALQLATGQASAELLAAARDANQRARSAAISERSLFSWLRTHNEKGWWGLLPTSAEPTVKHVDRDVAAAIGAYLSRDAQFRKLSLAAIEVTRQMGRPHDEWVSLYDRCRRALKKLDKTQVIKSRHAGAQRAAKLPFKRRDTSMLVANDVWLIDGHTFKAKVRHPIHGAPFAPEVTLAIDAATRRITGWSVSLSENTTAVGDALRHAVGRCGVPAVLYSDNGGGETGKAIDCPITGVLARLGVEHRTGLPGHPQGHGLIERSWQTHMIKAARQFGSYQGKDVDAVSFRKAAAELAKEQRAVRRAETTGSVVKLSTKAPSWQQFMDAVGAAVEAYNSQHRHRALPKGADGKHLTPAMAWSQRLVPEHEVKLSQLDLRMLFMPALVRTAVRGEVTIFNNVYHSPDLMQMQVDGKQVRVHYDIHDPNFVVIMTLAGEYVCEAKWNANKIDYMPKAVIEIGREKRSRAAIKRLDLRKDLAMREVQGILQHQPAEPFSLPVQPASIEVAELLHDVRQAANSSPIDAHAAGSPGRPFFDSQGDRYEWLMTHRSAWDGEDGAWVAQYVASGDYESLREYYEGRGLGWKDDTERFEGAQ